MLLFVSFAHSLIRFVLAHSCEHYYCTLRSVVSHTAPCMPIASGFGMLAYHRTALLYMTSFRVAFTVLYSLRFDAAPRAYPVAVLSSHCTASSGSAVPARRLAATSLAVRFRVCASLPHKETLLGVCKSQPTDCSRHAYAVLLQRVNYPLNHLLQRVNYPLKH